MALENKNEDDFGQKLEAVIFPLLAGIIGVGYCVGILFNNPLASVTGSPHALILLAIFAAIAFFPIKSLLTVLAGKSGQEKQTK